MNAEPTPIQINADARIREVEERIKALTDELRGVGNG